MAASDLKNVGIIIDKISPFIFNPIRSEVELLIEQFIRDKEDLSHDMLDVFQDRLSGNIKEYHLSQKTRSLVVKEVFKNIQKHEEAYNYTQRIFNFMSDIHTTDIDLEMERIWLNFQRKGEFLPLHNHSGIYSFVIWVIIPFNIQEELREKNPVLMKNRSGMFEFVYTDTLGKLNNYLIPVDRNWEGTIAVFPAELHHQVYPFYSSDGVRATISGNIRMAKSNGN